MIQDRIVLRVAAFVEAITLMILLLNLATAHWKPVTSTAGPVHGGAYLIIIVMAFLTEGSTRRARLTSLVPGVGGYLVLRQLAHRPA